MPEKQYTEKARRVLTLAHDEALRLNHGYIGTEHIMLGIVSEGNGLAAKVLSNLGVSLTKARSAVEFIIGRGDTPQLGEIGLTPRANKVVSLARQEARSQGVSYIGTEHLLIGIVLEGEGIAAKVLDSLGISLDQIRSEIARLVATPSTPPTEQQLTLVIQEFEAAMKILNRVGEQLNRYRLAAQIYEPEQEESTNDDTGMATSQPEDTTSDS